MLEKIELNFYFHTSLWYLKRFYEGLKGLHKTFWGTTKKCENKNLTYFFLFIFMIGMLRVKDQTKDGGFKSDFRKVSTQTPKGMNIDTEQKWEQK